MSNSKNRYIFVDVDNDFIFPDITNLTKFARKMRIDPPALKEVVAGTQSHVENAYGNRWIGWNIAELLRIGVDTSDIESAMNNALPR